MRSPLQSECRGRCRSGFDILFLPSRWLRVGGNDQLWRRLGTDGKYHFRLSNERALMQQVIFWGCLFALPLVSGYGLLACIRLCRHLQANHPLKWNELGFPPNWLRPSVQEESSQAMGQIGLMLFVLKGEYSGLRDADVNRLARSYRCSLALTTLLLIIPLLLRFG